MIISFQNKGLIDKRAIKTFGVSSKDTDTPIGFFGTGLKYAIAVLLREDHKVTVYVGHEKLEFGVTEAAIRNDDFNIITMNGEELGYTTALGKKWRMWQALREIYCNTIDECGDAQSGGHEPKEDYTTIHVEGSQFASCFAQVDEIILPEMEPRVRSSDAEVYNSPSNCFFFRRVRVMEPKFAPTYTYNIRTKIDLTEDRTVKYPFEVERAVSRTILTSTDELFIRSVLTSPEGSYEHHLDLADSYNVIAPSAEFMATIGKLRETHKGTLNGSALKIYHSYVPKQPPKESALDATEQQQLNAAVSFCELLGYSPNDYPIRVVESLGAEVEGLASEGQIFIAKRCFMRGTKYLAATLIEEFIHLRHELHDESRALQTFLFDAIVTLGEKHVLRKPL